MSNIKGKVKGLFISAGAYFIDAGIEDDKYCPKDSKRPILLTSTESYDKQKKQM